MRRLNTLNKLIMGAGLSGIFLILSACADSQAATNPPPPKPLTTAERLERIEAHLADTIEFLRDLKSDRNAAIKNAACSKSCEIQFGEWNDNEQKSRRDARILCYRDCQKSSPMPASIGGGC